MLRSFAMFAALALAVPALAADYSGKPVTPGPAGRIIARDIVWTQAEGVYRGSTNESRPLVLCQSLAKKAGRLESFSVNRTPVAAAALARCNAVAAQPASPALAGAN